VSTNTNILNGSENSAQKFAKTLSESRKEQLGDIQTLKDFRSKTKGKLSLDERKTIVEQALTLLEDSYVHLPLKKAMHAADPIQRLKLLQHRLDETTIDKMGSELDFHKEMIDIFTSVRDLHTNYLLPTPFAGHFAFLPFKVESFMKNENDDQYQFLVTGIAEGYENIVPATFKPGVKIIYWNGIPMQRAVEINANKIAGSNLDARFARGLAAMTVRPLRTSLPPDEEWIDIDYITEDGNSGNKYHQEWLVSNKRLNFVRPSRSDFERSVSSGFKSFDSSKNVYKIGVDLTTELVREVNKILFAPTKVIEAERRLANAKSVKELIEKVDKLESYMPDVIDVKKISDNVGHIRIRTFTSDKYENFVDQFVNEFLRLLKQLPKKGLIIDVRGNGGGYIVAAECILQFLTPRKIIPEPYQFISSPLTIDMTRKTDWLEPWASSLSQSINTGSMFSGGYPITTIDEANMLGQQYHGPVILVTDALCYSATDLFAAGFQDHQIGPILGVDGNTGAGGANVWEHSVLKDVLESIGSKYQLKKLPLDSNMRVSIRRNIRVREYAGTPVEDLGIIPNERHPMTKRDLLEENADLIEEASRILAQMPIRQLDADVANKDGSLEIDLTTIGIARVDIYIDERPMDSRDVTNGTTKLSINLSDKNAGILEIAGIKRNEKTFKNEIVAARKIILNPSFHSL
jgi:C-terminal processing protease CtpA/Prc